MASNTGPAMKVSGEWMGNGEAPRGPGLGAPKPEEAAPWCPLVSAGYHPRPRTGGIVRRGRTTDRNAGMRSHAGRVRWTFLGGKYAMPGTNAAMVRAAVRGVPGTIASRSKLGLPPLVALGRGPIRAALRPDGRPSKANPPDTWNPTPHPTRRPPGGRPNLRRPPRERFGAGAHRLKGQPVSG